MKKIPLRSIIAYALTAILVLIAPLTSMAQKSKPLVVFVCGDHEYSGEATLPIIATELEKNYGFRTKVLSAYPNQNAEKNIPGLEALAEADVAVFFLRWRQLPPEQLKHIDNYLNSGKPVMGFRTSTHAFNYPKGHESESWNAFGERAFGSPPGWGRAGHTHYGHESSTDVVLAPNQAQNPILRGVAPSFHVRSWLYRVKPDYPPAGAVELLVGTSVDPDKAAIPNPVAWTWTNKANAKVFFTTMGHPEDFKEESVQRLTINAIHWLAGKPIPKKWKGRLAVDVPYRGIVN